MKIKSKTFWIGLICSIILIVCSVTISVLIVTNNSTTKQNQSNKQITSEDLKNFFDKDKVTSNNVTKVKLNLDKYNTLINFSNFTSSYSYDKKLLFDETNIKQNMNQWCYKTITSNGYSDEKLYFKTRYEVRQEWLKIDMRWTNNNHNVAFWSIFEIVI